MQNILNSARKRVDKAEVFRIKKTTSPACFFGNKLKSLEGEDSIATCLRVIVNGRLGFSSSTHPDDKETLIDRAVASARFGPVVDMHFPADIHDFNSDERFYDEKVESVSDETLIDIGKKMIETVQSKFPKVSLELEISKGSYNIAVMNSQGGAVSYNKTLFQAFINALVILPSDRIELEHTATSTHLSDGPLNMANDLVWRFSNCANIIPVKTERMTVVFTSLGFRGLFVPLMFGFNGDMVNRKLSLLTGKLNKKIIDNRLTVIDDPAVPGFPGSCPVDDEGTLAKKKVLVKNGILKNYLYDLRSAAAAGAVSTGNGFKKASLYTGFSIDAPPNPYPSNLLIPGGSQKRDSIIKSIKNGIIVDDTMGAGQGNNLNGEFSMSIALGYRIKDGEIIGRIKDVMIAGNVFDILEKHFSEASEETWVEDTLFGRYSVPWLVFEDLLISAT